MAIPVSAVIGIHALPSQHAATAMGRTEAHAKRRSFGNRRAGLPGNAGRFAARQRAASAGLA